MNWFNLVNLILSLAPQELQLIKAITDVAHANHQNGTPIAPLTPGGVSSLHSVVTPPEIMVPVPIPVQTTPAMLQTLNTVNPEVAPTIQVAPPTLSDAAEFEAEKAANTVPVAVVGRKPVLQKDGTIS